MQKRRFSADVCLRAAPAVIAIACLLSPASGAAQEFRFEGGDWLAHEVGRDGTAIIVETEGPPLFGPREFYRPVPPLDLDHRWILVQDSTLGVAFTQPSGIKGELDGYVGDLFLRALAGVSAVEVRALVFNVWGDPAGHLAVTVLVERGAGERWEFHPRWTGVDGPPHEHRTSIAWINRVMFDDQSILEADMRPVAAAWEYVTGTDFEGRTDEAPLRAVGP